MVDQFSEIEKRIREYRTAGKVHLYQQSRPSLWRGREGADRYVTSLGFYGIDEYWEEISLEDAIKLIREILHRERAYKVINTPWDIADSIARDLLDLFGEAAYFTNCDPRELNESVFGSAPISDATFDLGVVIISEKKIGMVWVEDED